MVAAAKLAGLKPRTSVSATKHGRDSRLEMASVRRETASEWCSLGFEDGRQARQHLVCYWDLGPSNGRYVLYGKGR